MSRRLFTGSNLDETFLCIFQFHAENNASISLARRHPKPYPPTPSPGPAEWVQEVPFPVNKLCTNWQRHTCTRDIRRDWKKIGKKAKWQIDRRTNREHLENERNECIKRALRLPLKEQNGRTDGSALRPTSTTLGGSSFLCQFVHFLRAIFCTSNERAIERVGDREGVCAS